MYGEHGDYPRVEEKARTSYAREKHPARLL